MALGILLQVLGFAGAMGARSLIKTRREQADLDNFSVYLNSLGQRQDPNSLGIPQGGLSANLGMRSLIDPRQIEGLEALFRINPEQAMSQASKMITMRQSDQQFFVNDAHKHANMNLRLMQMAHTAENTRVAANALNGFNQANIAADLAKGGHQLVADGQGGQTLGLIPRSTPWDQAMGDQAVWDAQVQNINDMFESYMAHGLPDDRGSANWGIMESGIAAMQGMARKMAELGVINEADLPFIEAMANNPLDFVNRFKSDEAAMLGNWRQFARGIEIENQRRFEVHKFDQLANWDDRSRPLQIRSRDNLARLDHMTNRAAILGQGFDARIAASEAGFVPGEDHRSINLGNAIHDADRGERVGQVMRNSAEFLTQQPIQNALQSLGIFGGGAGVLGRLLRSGRL